MPVTVLLNCLNFIFLGVTDLCHVYDRRTEPIPLPYMFCKGAHAWANDSLSSSWMEMVAEFPAAVNVTVESAEDRVRRNVSNLSSSRVSSEIETLVHC